jgi:hypothetical protein
VTKLIDGRISIPEQLLRGGCRTDRTASDDANGPEKEATGTSEACLRDGTSPIADLEPQSINDRDHSHFANLSSIGKHSPIVESKKLFELRLPVLEKDLFASPTLILGEIQPHRDDAVQLANLFFTEVILGKVTSCFRTVSPFQVVRPMLGKL